MVLKDSFNTCFAYVLAVFIGTSYGNTTVHDKIGALFEEFLDTMAMADDWMNSAKLYGVIFSVCLEATQSRLRQVGRTWSRHDTNCRWLLGQYARVFVALLK